MAEWWAKEWTTDYSSEEIDWKSCKVIKYGLCNYLGCSLTDVYKFFLIYI